MSEEKKVDFDEMKRIFEEQCKEDITACGAELQESLTKYSCSLEYIQTTSNGQVVEGGFRVVKAQPKQNG